MQLLVALPFVLSMHGCSWHSFSFPCLSIKAMKEVISGGCCCEIFSFLPLCPN